MAAPTALDNLTPVQRVAAEMAGARERFHDFHEAIDFDLDFGLNLEHYKDDTRFDEKSAPRIKPRDPGIFRVWRYKTALIHDRFPIRVEARPKNRASSPEQVEDARRAVEAVMLDPYRNYPDCRRRMIGAAIGARAGATELCYDETGLYFDDISPKNVLWANGFIHPQHPRNPWCATWMRAPISWVKRQMNWKNVPDDLLPDDGQMSLEDPPSEGIASPKQRESSDNDLVTIVRFRRRFVKPVGTKSEQLVPLEDSMRYMLCPDCGWRSEPQAEAMVNFPDSTQCPQCGNIATRVDAHPHFSDGTKYSSGKQLLICAPFTNAPEPFYDGDWEFDYPCFPLAWFVAYPVPHAPFGQSDASILKTPTLAKNAIMRLTYETMIRSKPRWRMPSHGVNDVYGQPFNFGINDDIMVYDGAPGAIEIMQGQGVNGNMFPLYDRMDANFRTNESTSEVAMTPAQISEAKAGVVDAQQSSGNTSVDDHGKLLYSAETFIASCVAAALRQLPSEDVRYRNPSTGGWDFRRVGGDTMAPIDIEVDSGKAFDDINEQDVKQFMQLLQIPPEARAGFAALKHVDPSVIQKLPYTPPTPPPGAPGVPPQGPAPMPVTAPTPTAGVANG